MTKEKAISIIKEYAKGHELRNIEYLKDNGGCYVNCTLAKPIKNFRGREKTTFSAFIADDGKVTVCP